MKNIRKSFKRNIKDEDFLSDIKAVANKLGLPTISTRNYNNSDAKYSSNAVATRFGSWNNALRKTGLKVVCQRGITIDELFGNLEQVWIYKGRQPKFMEMMESFSKYLPHRYVSKFGTWKNGLVEFFKYMNSDKQIDYKTIEEEKQAAESINEIDGFKPKTKKFPNGKLKVRVLMRDGNLCRVCGTKLTDGNIHFNLIKPLSKGGTETLENLQVLCKTHNITK